MRLHAEGQTGELRTSLFRGGFPLKTKSHRLLGEYLIDNCRSPGGWTDEKAFLWGCVQPDYNILTYLKGSRSVQPLRGHNYKNAEPCILRTIAQLQRKTRWGMGEYYSLGKLIHYISDAFTYPHNAHYGKSLSGHLRYEEKLHTSFRAFAAGHPAVPEDSVSGSVQDYILSAHERYLGAEAGLNTDMRYILAAARTAFSLLLPDAETIFAGPWRGQYESKGYFDTVYGAADGAFCQEALSCRRA